MPLIDSKTLGPARLQFSDEKDLDAFVQKLEGFESGALQPDDWKQFRLTNGVYSQRQEDAMMVRVKIPQGALTAAQLRSLGDVARRFSTGRGHLTTRQNLQFHFVKLADTEAALRTLHDAGLTTREACGSSVRNITACPYAGASALEPFDVTPWGELLTRHLLRGPLSSGLPRKFKIAIGGCCGFDCVGASFNDIGLLARVRDGQPGFRVTLGGGLATLRRAGIVAHEFAPAEELFEIAEAVLRVFAREGDRKRRDKARLKFVVERLGQQAFLAQYFSEREKIAAEGGRKIVEVPLAPARPGVVDAAFAARATRPGFEQFVRENVRAQRDSQHVAVAVRLPLGDVTAAQLDGLADLAEQFSDEREVRTTIDQNFLIRFVARARLAQLHAALADLDLAQAGAGSVSDVTSCPGASSCKLAVTQSRGLASLLGEKLATVRADGLHLKISGCPNGCGQHTVAGIGLQGSVRKLGGRALPQYFVYVGGGFGQENASFGRLAAKVPARRVPEAVERLVALYERERAGNESAEEFLARLELPRAQALLKDLEDLPLAEAKAEDFVDLGEEKEFTVELGEGECAA